MAKVNIGGMVFEGTNDELIELFTKLGAKIPAVAETAVPASLTKGDYARVLATDRRDDRITLGEIRLIVEDDKSDCPFYAKTLDGSNSEWFEAHELALATDEEVAEAKRQQAEKAKKPALKVGDYAKVAPHVDHDSYAGPGDIVELIANGHAYDFEVEKLVDRSDCTFFDSADLIHATDEEVATAKAEVERKQAEKAVAAKAELERKELERKWTSINRKPNEFKKGDIVEITLDECGLDVGTIAEVREPLEDAVGVNGVKDGEMYKGYGASHHAVKLIAPVEARFDR